MLYFFSAPCDPVLSICQTSFPCSGLEQKGRFPGETKKFFRPYKIFPLFIIWNGVLIDLIHTLRRQSGLAEGTGQEKEENMPRHSAQKSVPGTRLLRLFILLLRDSRKHYLADLKRALGCSPQTILRMTDSIAAVTGGDFTTGMDNNRRWYRLEKDGSLTGDGETKGGQAGQEGIPRIAVSDILDIESGAISYAAHAEHIRTFLHAQGKAASAALALFREKRRCFFLYGSSSETGFCILRDGAFRIPVTGIPERPFSPCISSALSHPPAARKAPLLAGSFCHSFRQTNPAPSGCISAGSTPAV